MKAWRWALLVGLCIAHASWADETFSGYLKNFSLVQFEQTNGDIEIPRQAVQESSLRLMWEPKGLDWSTEFHYEIQGLFGSREWMGDSQLLRTGAQGRYRFDDLNAVFANGKKSRGQQSLDRANVRLARGAWDITLGRQALSLGSARIVSPTDVFLPFDLRVLDTEYRPGVDAIRFERSLGDLSMIDAGWIAGAEGKPEESAWFGRWITNARGVDLAATWIERPDYRLAGFAANGAAGQFGLWWEAARVSGRESYWRSSIGIDGGFAATGLWMLELHYNGAGEQDVSRYLATEHPDAYQNFGVFLLARRYVLAGLSAQLSGVTSIAAQAILNLDDRSSFFQASVDRYLSDAWSVQAGYYRFDGDEEIAITPAGIELGSEFGWNPHVVYVGIRYYF